ncbi:hypothetical protein OH492_23995 [Vibrio chagasii]|nr:hypothetical protein [Vibrio chagasii]
MLSPMLEAENLSTKSVALENGSILVRFNDTDSQISARDVITEALDEDVIVALNLAASTHRIGLNLLVLHQ